MIQATVTGGSTISKETMQSLKQYEGARIKVELVRSGQSKPLFVEEVLNRLQLVPRFYLVRMDHYNIQFVGTNQAIRTISIGDKMVYDNRANILESYPSLSVPEWEELQRKTFGEPEVTMPSLREG